MLKKFFKKKIQTLTLSTTAKVWLANHEFEGEPKLEDFTLKEETLPPLKDGEILIEAVFLSLDPYFRKLPVKDGLPGEQIARVIETKAEGFPKGALVCAHAGWRSRSIIDVNTPLKFGLKVELIDQVPGLSPSLWIGAIGIPGMTAYLSFLERCNPVKGEVIVISAASGAVGSIVGQLAKIEGLTVIGLAGSEDKCKYIKEIGFDHAINYKKEDISSVLDKVAPDGVDIYFDNVGGDVADVVFGKLRAKGRVLLCGEISTYNKVQSKGTNWNAQIISKELRVEGFFAFSPNNIKEYPRVRKELVSLFEQGKLKAKEHVTEGFENMHKAFLELFSGSNFGKAIVKSSSGLHLF
uniref:15-oxoprostaglandin 13-reductase n=1 Tax=Arion vulgaris TaxID=1028688 RepID=A0A0B7AVZ9_9EUPU